MGNHPCTRRQTETSYGPGGEGNKRNLSNQGLPIDDLIKIGIAGAVIIFFYRKKSHLQEELYKKQYILSQKQQETQSLKQKVNSTFEEVVQLAKENDASFLARFREVYSNVYQNITSLEPSLTEAELNFCAMLWLGFSTKDIARYTHIQPKSVQMKKYRLRKKMDLPKGQDLYEWVKHL